MTPYQGYLDGLAHGDRPRAGPRFRPRSGYWRAYKLGMAGKPPASVTRLCPKPARRRRVRRKRDNPYAE